MRLQGVLARLTGLATSRARRSLRPSRAGWLFIGITFAVGFAALNTGNNLLYLVLSLMLAFLVLSGFLSEAALRGIRVDRRLPVDLHARHRNRVVLRIENVDPRLASFALVVEDRLGRDAHGEPAGRCFALRIAPGETVQRDYALVPEQRGVLAFGGYRLSTRFPFGLFVKSVWINEAREALVYPELELVTPAAPDAGQSTDAEDAQARDGGGVMLAGLREYVPGDGLRRVQWRQSARRGALFVGEAEDELLAEVEVELPQTNTPTGEADALFEGQVRRAASEVVHHLDAGLRVGLRTPGERFAPDLGRWHRSALLRHLALIERPVDAGEAGR